jgi:hypothetical protein
VGMKRWKCGLYISQQELQRASPRKCNMKSVYKTLLPPKSGVSENYVISLDKQNRYTQKLKSIWQQTFTAQIQWFHIWILL